MAGMNGESVDEMKIRITETAIEVSDTNSDHTPLLKENDIVDAPAYADEFSGLAPSEAKILREQVASTETSASFWSLFRYANKFDALLLFFGTVSAIAEGCMRPLMTVSNFAETRYLLEL